MADILPCVIKCGDYTQDFIQEIKIVFRLLFDISGVDDLGWVLYSYYSYINLRQMNKGIGGHHSPRMQMDVWLTDPAIIRSLGVFDLDPC